MKKNGHSTVRNNSEKEDEIIRQGRVFTQELVNTVMPLYREGKNIGQIAIETHLKPADVNEIIAKFG